MKKLLLIPLLALAACGPLDTVASVSGTPPPAALADKTKLDEKAGLAVESLYQAVVRAGALAFRSGLIAPSPNPTVHQPGFCALVAQGRFRPTDAGANLNALECKLRVARDLTRASYDALNGDSYDTAAREAIRIAKEILALLGSN